MTRIIFWDEDTQRDFMEPDGKLYVPGAEHIVPNLEKLTRCAREYGVQIVAVMCDHTEADAEISSAPDYQTTFPPHCMRGTRGQERLEATRPRDPLYLENRAYTRAEMTERLRQHRGEIVIKKQALNPLSNPATATLLEVLAPQTVIVYGVASDFCVHQAIMALADGKRRVCFVRDAAKAINAEAAAQCEAEWRQRGVEVVSTDDIVEQRVVRFVA